MQGLLRVLGFAGLALGVLAYPAAWAVDRAAGTEVLIVMARDAASEETERGLWELNGSERAEAASIYGTPTKEPVRLVFADPARVLRPKEDPSLVLYLLRDGDQAQTLWYFALPATAGGLVAGAALLFLSSRMKRKKADPAPSPA